MTPEERERTRQYVERLNARYRTLKDEVDEDLEPYRRMTPEQADRAAVGVVRAATKLLSSMPVEQRRRIVEPDPPQPDFARIWARLVARRRQRK